MDIKVTHTLPSETYPAWVAFANAARLMILNPQAFDEESAKEILILYIVKIDSNATKYMKIFEAGFPLDGTPVDPLCLALATLFRTVKCVTEPPSEQRRYVILTMLIELIAVSYDRNIIQVMDDLLAHANKTETQYDSFILEKYTPTSKEIH